MKQNDSVLSVEPVVVMAGVMALVPYLAAAFAPRWAAGCVRSLPSWAQIGLPSLLGLPYVLVTLGAGNFAWGWLAVYGLMPVAIAGVLWTANRVQWQTRWPELLILLALGLAVDLRWQEGAWPAHLNVFNKILLLDAGVYGFVALRPLEGTGFDLRLRPMDVVIGLREMVIYTPLALALGLSLGFLHLHLGWPGLAALGEAWIFTFFFIAVPEELFFRGWMQNLLERWMGRWAALGATAILFGLAHFNTRAAFFNWRYVLLAAIAGVFYGRAWRAERRVGASAVTHATVDSIWSLWLR